MYSSTCVHVISLSFATFSVSHFTLSSKRCGFVLSTAFLNREFGPDFISLGQKFLKLRFWEPGKS